MFHYSFVIDDPPYIFEYNNKFNDIAMKTIEGYTYRVNQFIGKGYSSTVHKGINKNGQEVSIKVIEMAKLEDPINQMLLQLEVTALKVLAGSQHILHLYDVYATKNNTYLITELCEGDMSAMIKQRKTVPYFQAVQIMRQLIEGYHCINKAGFVHRDVKPANIFHKNGVYKYGDFGFTIPVSELQAHKHYNVGSPVYMPPEALKNNDYSVSCDIWALGIIFYQLLKGIVPWRALSEQVLYEKIMNEGLGDLTVGMPEPAKRFLGEVLHLDPKLRPTPDKMLSWHSQLQSANIQIRHLSPLEQRGRNTMAPLRQLTNNIIANGSKPSISNYQVVPKIAPSNQNKSMPPMLISKVQQTPRRTLNELKVEDGEFKQAYFFANNWLNYIRFLHRVLKFVAVSSEVELGQLGRAITKCLFEELDSLKDVMEGVGNEPRVEQWGEFLQASKSQGIRKKVKKYQSKYKMFHDPSFPCDKLEGKQILQGINRLISHLQVEGFVPKLVVAADYLTTLYQLLHLREKYYGVEFMKISKIDLIMQGNPYNTSAQHFQKLKRKLQLITP